MKPGIKWQDPKEMAERGRKGGKACVARYCIQGESVTIAEVAARLGCTPDQAGSRMSKARRQDGPVVWARLAR